MTFSDKQKNEGKDPLFLQTLLDTIPNPIFYKDNNGVYLGCNKAFEKYLGMAAEDIIGKSVYDVAPKELADVYFEMDNKLLNDRGTQVYEASVLDADRQRRDVVFNKAVFYNSEGQVGGLVGVIVDITERKIIERQIWEEKERAQVTLQSIGDAVITTDREGRIEYLNAVAEDLTGWNNADAGGVELPEVFTVVNEETGFAKSNPVEICINESRIIKYVNNTVLVHRDGHRFAIESSAAPIKNREGQIVGTILVFRDVSEKRSLIQQMAYQANHDLLTGLPNRILFKDRLNQSLAQFTNTGKKVAVMFADLDRFKHINDALGHAAGDQLLKLVAGRLEGAARKGDTVARLGGDEFTILINNIDHEENVAGAARNFLRALEQPFIVFGHEFHVTASIGIAIFPYDGKDAHTLMKHADAAMFRAKETGRNRFQMFTQALNDRIMKSFKMESRLRRALERNELILYYQPKVNVRTWQVTGFEALLRWHHPEKGLISPGEFIPLAEETGLIIPIGEWVIREACVQHKNWIKEGHGHVPIAVNLSAHQFHDKGLLDRVRDTVVAVGIDPRFMEFEITESAAMQDVNNTIKTLHQLKHMGFTVAVDDFGTGHSSLSYLKQFPIDSLKIDRSFIQDLSGDTKNGAIVASIVALANNLNLNVIAEGVESRAQLRRLRRQNCIEMQGYYFARPMAPQQLDSLSIKKQKFNRLFISKGKTVQPLGTYGS